MSLIFRVFISTLIVAVLFIITMPGEWKRWLVLWACIFGVFLAIMGVVFVMGVSLI